jgi:hypothetical protein
MCNRGQTIKVITWEDLDDLAEDIASSVCLSELAVDKDIHDDKETCRRDRKEDTLKDVVSICLLLDLFLAALSLIAGIDLIDDPRLCNDLPLFRLYENRSMKVSYRSVGDT